MSAGATYYVLQEVNPVDALRELRETLTALDRAPVEMATGTYQLEAAKREARAQVLRSIAALARMLRMVQVDEPKEGA